MRGLLQLQTIRSFCTNRPGQNGFNIWSSIEETQSLLTPRRLVTLLDECIIGQAAAKKSISAALRARWRRRQLPVTDQKDITARNMLMSGPTGCGKTEIARRLAKLVDAPFLRVEATRYTQVGYVGKDVSAIIQDLAKIGMQKYKRRYNKAVEMTQHQIDKQVWQSILNLMVDSHLSHELRHKKLNDLKKGQYDSRTVNVAPQLFLDQGYARVEIRNAEKDSPQGSNQQQQLVNMTIQKLFRMLKEKKIDTLQLHSGSRSMNDAAAAYVENHGIVFIDQMDKIAVSPNSYRAREASVSRVGVQRDLLPLLEGTSVKTPLGNIKTDNIFFIAAGAFSQSRVQDLMPELLGRLPMRVQLQPLSMEQYRRVLSEPKHSLLKQQISLMARQGVQLEFTTSAIDCLASSAWLLNNSLENTGVRRLHGIVERVCQELSFTAHHKAGQKITITDSQVKAKLKDFEAAKINIKKHLI